MGKKYLLVLVLLVCLQVVFAAEAIDQQQQAWDNDYHLYYGGFRYFQSFIPQQHTLTSIDLYLAKFGNPSGIMILRVFYDNNGVPNFQGAVLSEASYNIQYLTSSYTWKKFDLPNKVVTPGTRYWIELYPSVGDISNYVAWGAKSPGNPYANGKTCVSASDGSLMNCEGPQDATFITYYDVGATQPPIITDYYSCPPYPLPTQDVYIYSFINDPEGRLDTSSPQVTYTVNSGIPQTVYMLWGGADNFYINIGRFQAGDIVQWYIYARDLDGASTTTPMLQFNVQTVCTANYGACTTNANCCSGFCAGDFCSPTCTVNTDCPALNVWSCAAVTGFSSRCLYAGSQLCTLNAQCYSANCVKDCVNGEPSTTGGHCTEQGYDCSCTYDTDCAEGYRCEIHDQGYGVCVPIPECDIDEDCGAIYYDSWINTCSGNTLIRSRVKHIPVCTASVCEETLSYQEKSAECGWGCADDLCSDPPYTYLNPLNMHIWSFEDGYLNGYVNSCDPGECTTYSADYSFLLTNAEGLPIEAYGGLNGYIYQEETPLPLSLPDTFWHKFNKDLGKRAVKVQNPEGQMEFSVWDPNSQYVMPHISLANGELYFAQRTDGLCHLAFMHRPETGFDFHATLRASIICTFLQLLGAYAGRSETRFNTMYPSQYTTTATSSLEDLEITNATLLNEHPTAGQLFGIRFYIKNSGASTLSNIHWKYLPDNYDGEEQEGNIASLAPDEDTEITIQTSYDLKGLHLSSIFVDDNNLITELDEDNNNIYKLIYVFNEASTPTNCVSDADCEALSCSEIQAMDAQNFCNKNTQTCECVQNFNRNNLSNRTVFNQVEWSANEFVPVHFNSYYAQSFISDSDLNLGSAALLLSWGGYLADRFGDMTVTILNNYVSEGQDTPYQVLASSSFALRYLTPEWSWVYFNFPNNLSLKAGEKYWVLLQEEEHIMPNHIKWAKANYDVDPGNGYYRFNLGIWGSNDLALKIYAKPNLPPDISDVYHSPTVIKPNQDVYVYADLFDIDGNLKEAKVVYSVNNGPSLITTPMIWGGGSGGRMYYISLGKFQALNSVKYHIHAVDLQEAYTDSADHEFVVQSNPPPPNPPATGSPVFKKPTVTMD